MPPSSQQSFQKIAFCLDEPHISRSRRGMLVLQMKLNVSKSEAACCHLQRLLFRESILPYSHCSWYSQSRNKWPNNFQIGQSVRFLSLEASLMSNLQSAALPVLLLLLLLLPPLPVSLQLLLLVLNQEKLGLMLVLMTLPVLRRPKGTF